VVRGKNRQVAKHISIQPEMMVQGAKSLLNTLTNADGLVGKREE
jgi:hypothetical protein